MRHGMQLAGSMSAVMGLGLAGCSSGPSTVVPNSRSPFDRAVADRQLQAGNMGGMGGGGMAGPTSQPGGGTSVGPTDLTGAVPSLPGMTWGGGTTVFPPGTAWSQGRDLSPPPTYMGAVPPPQTYMGALPQQPHSYYEWWNSPERKAGISYQSWKLVEATKHNPFFHHRDQYPELPHGVHRPANWGMPGYAGGTMPGGTVTPYIPPPLIYGGR